MQTKLRNFLKLPAILLLVMALLASGLYRWNVGAASILDGGACTGTGTVTCDLWAKGGTIDLPGAAGTPIWGYATSVDGAASVPGPVLIVNEGDTVTVTLHNSLAESTSLLFQGQNMIPDTTGAAAGGTKTYTFTASKPGTFLYEAGLVANAEHQVAMGMYGALIVRPATANQAYDSASSAYDEEALLVLSELDPALNASATPAAFDMRDYHPRYFLINGKAYPDTVDISVNAGSKVLLRYVNAGLQAHAMSLLGLSQTVIAIDGSPYSGNAVHTLTAQTIATGQTSDVLVSMPSAASAYVGTRYALYDAAFMNYNNTNGFGGMLTFLTLASGLDLPSTDKLGPITSNVTVSAPKVQGGNVTVSASISDSASGNSNVDAAEYFIDTTSGTSIAISGTFGSPSVSVSVTFDASTLATGNHTIYVHGQDSAGNWGPFGSVALAVDRTGPVISGMELDPNPSQGSGVVLSASADDRGLGGNSFVGYAEYQIDGGGWTEMTFETSASTSFFTAVLPSVGAGSPIVSVRAIDEFGNIGAVSIITMIVDQTGAVTNTITVSPSGTINGQVGVNSSVAAVRVTATFTDGASNVAAAEGFLTTLVPTPGFSTTTGAEGTGIVFIPSDGTWDEPNETGYIDIPLAQFWLFGSGTGPHTLIISVRAKDAAGNWGTFKTISVTVNIP